jgi:hypothetical protein
MNNLSPLSHEHYYQAWARFPIPVAHGDLEEVSLGTFKVAGDGTLWTLDGSGPAEFVLSEPRDLGVVVDVVVSVEEAAEAVTDTIAGSIILGGAVTGSDDEGHATLTTTYHHAILDPKVGDLTTAAGECILATPSTAATDDENRGLWFVSNDDVPQVPSLDLPTPLGEGWVYSAWIIRGAEQVKVGDFSDPAAADSDSAGAEAGPDSDGFAAPGSDFVQPAPRDLNDGTTTVVVSVAPGAHDEHGASPLLHEEPFPLRVLEFAVPAGVRPDSALTLARPTTPFPTGSVTFTR